MASWKDNLLPAQFRGVDFHWDRTGAAGGRRLAIFEFPQRETAYVEDLGRRIRVFPMTGYVLGDDYMAARDLLEAALDAPGPGTLNHPYRGPIAVQCDRWSSEEVTGEGRIARFEMHFVLAGPLPSPRSASDTATAVATACDDADAALSVSFEASFSLDGVPAFVQDGAASLVSDLGTAASSLLSTVNAIEGVVAADVAVVTGAIAAVRNLATAILEAPAQLALTVASLFGAVVDAAVNAVASIVAAAEAIPDALSELTSIGEPSIPDPSFGLAAFASYGADLAAIPPGSLDGTQGGANQAAFVALVQGSAVAALGRLYANRSFASAADAEAARDQITALIDTQLLAAGDDGAVQAWTQLYAASSIDLTTRGKQLPDLISFTTAAPMPSLFLANRLYQDAGRAAELVARNAVIHPAFMPTTIEALSS